MGLSLGQGLSYASMALTPGQGEGVWSHTLTRLRTWIVANKNTGPNARAAMSSPPTITSYTTKDAAYSVLYPAAVSSALNPAFPGLICGGNVAFLGGFSLRPQAFTSSAGSRGTTAARVFFNVNVADGLEFRVLRTAGYRFALNGRYLSFAPTFAPNPGVNDAFIKLAGPLSGELMIEITGPDGGISSINVKPGDTVTKPTYTGPRMIVQGDSFIGGAGGVLGSATIAYVMADYLGIKDVWQSGQGGRSFTGATFPFPAVISDVNNYGPWDLIAMAGGFNDKGVADATFLAAAQPHYQSLRTNNPAAYILGIGPWDDDAPSAADVGQVGINNALKTFLPIPGSVYQDKTGIAYTKVDAIHPDTAGHLALGAGVASEFITQIGA